MNIDDVKALLDNLRSSQAWHDSLADKNVIEPSPSVATLLSQLQSPEVKSYTFQQALPVLAKLSEDINLKRSLAELKKQQADLEQQLWDERLAIQKKYEEKVKIARTKANMIGAVLTKHEADTLSHAFQMESRKFDTERVLPAWDGLLMKQQAVLQRAAVPTMFVTDLPKDRERQQKVIQVLEGITG